MKGLKVITMLAIIIAFFLTVRLNTKGYLLTPEFIDSEEIDRAIEQIDFQNGHMDIDRDILVNDIINWKVSEHAIISEAEKLGISVSEDELSVHIEEQMKVYEEIIANGDSGFSDFLEEENLTIEEYFWEYNYEEMKRQLIYSKLMEHYIDNETNEYDFDGFNEALQQFERNYRNEHKKQIELLKLKYGVDDVKQPPIFEE